MEYIKNPIVLGLLTSCSSYIILKHKNKSEYEDISFIEQIKYPIILGILVFIGMTLLNSDNNLQIRSNIGTFGIGTSKIQPIIPHIIQQTNPISIKTIGDALPPINNLTIL